MHIVGSQGPAVAPETWSQQEVRNALAARDISAVYRQLRLRGISQRQIAAMTGQSQSEVSEILKGRQVMAYDVLIRIADGLGVPRGYMGLAYDEATALQVTREADAARAKAKEDAERLRFLQHAASVTMGAHVPLGTEGGTWDTASMQQTPVPNRIGLTEVRQIEAATRALRSLDHQYGSGFCRDAVLAQLIWTRQLLDAGARDEVKLRLYRAIADMHNLAGWSSFDAGLLDPARAHFAKALELAKNSGSHGLVANVLYRMGRVYLHNCAPDEALKLFQLGQIAAQESGSALTVAVLCANEAWAYGMLNRPDQVIQMVHRTRDEAMRARAEEVPSWFSSFEDCYGTLGAALGALAGFAEHRQKYAPLAVNELLKHAETCDPGMRRTHALSLGLLAVNYIRAGNVEQGIRIGHQAIKISETVNSMRIADRLKPLQYEAAKRKNNSDALDLANRVKKYRAV